MTKLSLTAGKEPKDETLGHTKNSIASLKTFKTVNRQQNCKSLSKQYYSSVILPGTDKPKMKIHHYKLANPSHSHRDAPVDEYSESGNYVYSRDSQEAQSERNHYSSKIDVTHSELSKKIDSNSIEKRMPEGRNISKMNIPAHLASLNSKTDSEGRKVRTTRLHSKDTQIIHIENSPEKGKDNESGLKKYLTKTEAKPPIKAKVSSKKAKTRKGKKVSKFSPGTENHKSSKAKKISLREEYKLSKRRSINK
mmetsp:Transcript_20107/g.19740  ORF Transcript_20107/g.19740 Transcript_20107/m.19740 type:complete len:251 (-) Transcript_20107:1091-1843(-)